MDLTSVTFCDTSNGWIAGTIYNQVPNVLRTTNAGRTWFPIPTDTIFYSISALSSSGVTQGVAVGFDRLFLTSDGGSHWTSLSQRVTLSHESLFCIAFADKRHGMIEGGFGLLRTTDAGKTWTRCSSGGGGSDISMPTTTFAVAVGYNGLLHTNVQWTTDGGNTWTAAAATGGFPLERVSFCDTLSGIAIGSGVIVTTSDGCATWLRRNPGAGVLFNGVCMPDPCHAFVVGDGGTILRTSDGGQSWERQASGTSCRLMSVSSPDERHATVVGDSGLVLHTNDGGVKWVRQSIGPPATLVSVSFVDSAYGMVVGQDVFRTTDGGDTWKLCSKATSSRLNDGWCIDRRTVTVVGEDGIILNSTTRGVTWVQGDRHTQNIPDKLLLTQNYPNPFNPTTTIEYGIPMGTYGTASLRVYDLMGRELATLVNEVKKPGAYSVQWNATGVATGVYFYRLSVGNYTQIRKLMVLK